MLVLIIRFHGFTERAHIRGSLRSSHQFWDFEKVIPISQMRNQPRDVHDLPKTLGQKGKARAGIRFSGPELMPVKEWLPLSHSPSSPSSLARSSQLKAEPSHDLSPCKRNPSQSLPSTLQSGSHVLFLPLAVGETGVPILIQSCSPQPHTRISPEPVQLAVTSQAALPARPVPEPTV